MGQTSLKLLHTRRKFEPRFFVFSSSSPSSSFLGVIGGEVEKPLLVLCSSPWLSSMSGNVSTSGRGGLITFWDLLVIVSESNNNNKIQ